MAPVNDGAHLALDREGHETGSTQLPPGFCSPRPAAATAGMVADAEGETRAAPGPGIALQHASPSIMVFWWRASESSWCLA